MTVECADPKSTHTKKELVSKTVPFAADLNIKVDTMVRSFARQGITIYVPMELSGGVKQCLFDIEKYKELNEEEDLKIED